MYSLLIVDDEPLVLVGLQTMLPWAELEIELAGTSQNGQQALEIIREQRVDIVLMDIRMPVIDGIELMRRCDDELDDPPEFIVLTSYEEFSYARVAIRHNAVDYLVKLTLTPNELRESVERAKRARSMHRRVDLSGEQPATEVFSDRIFLSLLNRGFETEEEAIGRLESAGVSFPGGTFAAVACRVSFPETMKSDEEQVNGYFCTVNMLKEIVGREFGLQILPLDRSHFAMLISSGASESLQTQLDRRIYNSLAKSARMVDSYFSVKIAGGVGSSCERMLQLADSYSEAQMALERTDHSRPLLVFSDVDSGDGDASSAGLGDLRDPLERAFTTMDSGAIRSVLDVLAARLGREFVHFSQGLDVCIELLYLLRSEIEGAEGVLDDIFSGVSGGYRSLYSGYTLAHVIEWLRKLSSGLVRYVAEQRPTYQEMLLRSMQRYVEEHYTEKLTVQHLAQEFQLSPNYVSAFFSKNTGQRFTDYLARVRVNRAKDLLSSGRYRIYEVSSRVGFDNQYYFSKVFKKITGMNPSDCVPRD